MQVIEGSLYSQEYNELLKEYKNMESSYSKLKSSVESIYKDGLSDELYKNKLENEVDTIVLNLNNDNSYSNYAKNQSETLEKLIKNSFNEYQTDKLKKIFNIRESILKYNKEILGLDTIGTSLNVLRDFYKDVYIDMIRSKISWTKNSQSEGQKNYMFDVKTPMEIEISLEVD